MLAKSTCGSGVQDDWDWDAAITIAIAQPALSCRALAGSRSTKLDFGQCGSIAIVRLTGESGRRSSGPWSSSPRHRPADAGGSVAEYTNEQAAIILRRTWLYIVRRLRPEVLAFRRKARLANEDELFEFLESCSESLWV